MFVRFATLLFSLAFLTCSTFAADAESSAVVGRKIADFTLTDYRGKEVSLHDFQDEKLIVVAFLGTDCPLAKLYGPRLESLAKKYEAQKVGFLGINSNRQDTLTEIGAHARRHGITFPVLKDGGHSVANAFGAIRTPEVFVLDQDRMVRYWGRIDDQYGIGYVRDNVETSYLGNALDELLAGESVSTPVVEAVGCHIGRKKEPKENSPVTYSNQIARTFNTHCIECHREGEIGPFPLTNYEEVVGWAEMIREVVNEKRMPPWHADPAHGSFENDISLTKQQIADIDLWVRNGAPEGNPAEKPALPQFTTGWQLPRVPDLVVAMADNPFKVQAEGEVRYQYFEVDPGFKEDKFIEASEIIPGNREVVHHILVNVVPPKDRRFPGAGGGEWLTGYVPGSRFKPLPEGLAKFVPAGSKLRFQVHYTPIGVEVEDLSKVGFLFADPKTIDKLVVTQLATNTNFLRGRKFAKQPPEKRPADSYIPAGAENHPIPGRSVATPLEVELLHLMPHMHLRGKSFTYQLVRPGKQPETVLHVPAYDFNWQTAYRLNEEIKLPAGSYMQVVGYFDNSENNLANPDPSHDVLWGDQTDDEMMIGYFDIAVPVSVFDDSELRLNRTNPANETDPVEKQAQALFQVLDANKDGAIEKQELSDPKQIKLFPLIDANSDKKISLEELTAGLKQLAKLKK